MSEPERGRSPELDQVRHMLFPDLSPSKGWARIDGAITGASDSGRWSRIEGLAGDDLRSDLLERLRLLQRPPDEDVD
jgi:hypothetical protein